MRYLGKNEKEKSRKLWEQVFQEDSQGFLDYYYSEKTKDNEILVEEKDGVIISMVHRNPFRMYLKGSHAPSEYIVGVATREDQRGKGNMRRLLMKCMQDAYDAHIPFQFLMPAAEAIYTPYGFRYVSERPVSMPVLWVNSGFYQREADEGDYRQLASFANLCLAYNGGLYVQRDTGYFARLHKERRSDGGGIRILFDEYHQIAGYYSYYEGEEKPDITEAIFRPGFHADDPRQLKNMKYQPHLMARITCLVTFLRCFTIPSGLLEQCEADPVFDSPSVYLDVADLMIPGNHGHFLWYFRESRSHVIGLDVERRASLKGIGAKQRAAVVIDIADLGSWLFGYRSFDELVEEGLMVGPEESLELLRKVKVLQHIYIREEV